MKHEISEMNEEEDRAWYDNEEEGPVMMDADKEYVAFVGDKAKFVQQESVMEKRNQLSGARNFRERERNEEYNKWEIDRMRQSGVLKEEFFAGNDGGFFGVEEEEERAVLMVHDIKPPFLDGGTLYTTQMDEIQVVKDPNSGMGQLAKKGSAILKVVREKNDRAKMRERFWELAGSKIGNLMQVSEDKPARMSEAGGNSLENKNPKNNQYQAALKNQGSSAATSFSKNKSLKEQREYLPIFSVREELLKKIQENRVYFFPFSIKPRRTPAKRVK